MEILETPLVQILLWVVAAAATFWIFVPGVMYLRRKNRYWVDVSGNPTDAEPDGRDRKYEERFKQFAALGFRPAGKVVEHARFMSPIHWSWQSDTRYLASPDGKTFIGFDRIGGGGPLRATAHSTFTQGGLIKTASPGVPVPAEAGGNYKYEAVGETQPEELLGMHERRVQEFARARTLTAKAATMQEIAAEDETYARLMLPKMKLGQYGAILSMFVMPAVMTLAGAASGRIGAFAPVILLAMAAMYALIRWSILPSRIPMMARMAVMGAGILIPALLLISWMTPDRMVGRALDRIDAKRAKSADPAKVDPAYTARTVKWIAEHQGRHSCKTLIPRYEDPARTPQTRAIAHDALVKLRGSDLGTRAAWDAWCAEVTRPKD